MRNEIRYPLRYFGSYPDAKVSAEKIIWIDDEIFFLKYLCRECGYGYVTGIPLCLVKTTRFLETPVAMIREEDQTCSHIWGYDEPKKPFLLLKFRVMSEIRVLQEKFPTEEKK